MLPAIDGTLPRAGHTIHGFHARGMGMKINLAARFPFGDVARKICFFDCLIVSHKERRHVPFIRGWYRYGIF
jgi:hypothetical protein